MKKSTKKTQTKPVSKSHSHQHNTLHSSGLKVVAAIIFIVLPFLGFIFGVAYQQMLQPDDMMQQDVLQPQKIVVTGAMKEGTNMMKAAPQY